ncbi:hypothetical protein U9M73_16010 [Paenibacillus phoenicis]|uniref:Uncharacterized protein n=1 Tax=Paenibacillus phoenicis TaxID=554117 RepID=A0ABU5PND8_9BACL|nr:MULTISPECIES: hypothetical protein [Paenibacillus]EES74685.1 hypothetical protein POTG_00965 [Paenibacillus sp. oral taxon 786 str. D14]MCT2195738.1 hypothetical protein [Paenibacillus sp. p3-SID1389]MEA3571458.1 hypothetical protein [Paenibacillus phoenicis]
MLIRKYLTTLLIAAFSMGYIIWTDILIGLPWNNFLINWSYSLTDPAERICAYMLFLFLIIPDIYHFVSRKRNGGGQTSGHATSSQQNEESSSTSANKDSSNPSEDLRSGMPPEPESVNQGGYNQSGGHNNIK